ncbi:N-acetylmuramoyl-L-alanine amidase [Actinoplanes campanulatus]|uniref:N-acetylmuramoyl-L-alanine amidase n=1 Tax=Actinoplanes campanulatus TaxID=113559 RepID=UPI0031E25E72
MQRRLTIGIGTAVAVLAAGGGIAALTWPSTSEAEAAEPVAVTGTLAAEPNPEPPRVKTALNTVGLTANGAKADLAQQRTKRFSLLGVTWNDGGAAPDGTIEVRTRSVATGKWSDWRKLAMRDDAPSGVEAGDLGRGATAPLWVGPSDGVAARIAGRGAGLPAGLRVDLIDPGSESGGRGGVEPSPSASASPSVEPTTAEPSAEPTGEPTEPVAEEPAPGETTTSTEEPPATGEPTAEPSPSTDDATKVDSLDEQVVTPTADAGIAAVTAVTTAPIKAQFPTYYSRKAWSADETITKPTEISVANQVQTVWVHHTYHAGDSSNDYECADAPAIIRAIQAYDIKSDGFSDIGYNYLVDKCGRLYEGRTGGVENAVVPAAVKGFNTGYASIAVLGDYRYAESTDAIETTIAQVAAARLGRYGYNPASTVTLTAGSANSKLAAGDKITVARLAGHSDADATLCPGSNLYGALADMRAKAQLMVTGLALKSVTGGGYSAGAWYVKNAATVSWTVGNDSAEIAQFDVWVDGAVAGNVPGTARSATVSVPAGKHWVTIVARHTSGSTARFGVWIFGDTTAPTFRATPAVLLRTGTYSTGSVPVTFYPNGADNLKLAGYTVSRPVAGNLGPVTSWATAVRPGTATWTVTARDLAGNTRGATITRAVLLSPETAAKKTGTWTKKTGSAYLGGKALSATRKNAKLTWTFTGRHASLLFSRAAKSGKVAVYVDGKKVTTIDLRSSKSLYRQAVWTRNLAYGKHTVAIVVQGTSGRPTVVSDGLAYVR